ncbi:9675_t:CDS:1 [Diversispora eburnea]|uniref:9675_t:CDS:1 n=1 Tax=Diversispora eburnea TaxID=1213867 RepID=A0A9N8W0K0_9GLOM|nr:9675_t:CDS:1 [Diversispora eburnea]
MSTRQRKNLPNINQRIRKFRVKSSHIGRKLIDGNPITSYLIEKLHLIGYQYYNDKSTSFAELRVEGITRTFWIHKEFLVLQSNFFHEIFNDKNIGTVIDITVPSPGTFESILEYLYDGNEEKWYDTFTTENWHSVWENISYLELGSKARAICISFCENQIN